MARSAERLAAAALCALVAGALAGCDSTQDKNKRAEVAAKRKLAARKPVEVKLASRVVAVDDVQAVGHGKRALIVVSLTNKSGHTLSDLPISVWAGGRLLNRGPNLYYFANHVPAAAARKPTLWIAQLGRRIPAGRLTAKVGAPSARQKPDAVFPDLRTTQAGIQRRAVRGQIENSSGPPQYVVELYAVARSRGRWVAAGRSRVTKLGTGDRRSFTIPLEGRLGKIKPEISAAPGILASAGD